MCVQACGISGGRKRCGVRVIRVCELWYAVKAKWSVARARCSLSAHHTTLVRAQAHLIVVSVAIDDSISSGIGYTKLFRK